MTRAETLATVESFVLIVGRDLARSAAERAAKAGHSYEMSAALALEAEFASELSRREAPHG